MNTDKTIDSPMKGAESGIDKIGVVLLNWNGGEYTIPCIDSLLSGKVIPWRIIVVDNGSTDDSADLIAKKFPFIQFIRNKENLGFTVANNQGIRQLLSDGANYVWVLNSDTIVDENCLEELLKAAKSYPDIVCFSGKIYYDSRPDRIWYAGGYRHRVHLGAKHRGEREIDQGIYDEIEEVEFISGCCMFFPSWALMRLGLFVDGYFGYSEDSEWCWRAEKEGRKLLYVPSATLKHCVSALVQKNTGDPKRKGSGAFASYLKARNHFWTIRRHATPFHKKFLALSVLLCLAFKTMTIRTKNRQWPEIRATVKGVWHGLLRTLPKA
jgi:hypothetical protein